MDGQIQEETKEEKLVGGFLFTSDYDAGIAKQEYKKVCYLREHMDCSDTDMLEKMYCKAIETRAFQTPVGLGYLQEIRERILHKMGEDYELPAIPLYVTYTQKIREQQGRVTKKIRPTRQKEKIDKFKISVVLNLLMGVLVIAMFIIVMESSQPNILNYENAIQNKYASWEQELKQREDAVRQKEQELNISE